MVEVVTLGCRINAYESEVLKEKLAGAKNNVRIMQESVLRDRVAAFLDAHPEFCDEFLK